MSKYKLLLFMSAFFTLFTFLGHTMGALHLLAPKEPEVAQLFQVMGQTMMPMLVGSPKSYAEVFHGANFGLSIYLLITGISLILFARAKQTPGSLIILTSVGLFLMMILCFRFFFPLPTICLGLSAILALMANGKKA